MAHLLAIAFFSGLLIALGMVLEFILRAEWAAICVALRGAPAQEMRGAPRGVSRRVAA